MKVIVQEKDDNDEDTTGFETITVDDGSDEYDLKPDTIRLSINHRESLVYVDELHQALLPFLDKFYQDRKESGYKS